MLMLNPLGKDESARDSLLNRYAEQNLLHMQQLHLRAGTRLSGDVASGLNDATPSRLCAFCLQSSIRYGMATENVPNQFQVAPSSLDYATATGRPSVPVPASVSLYASGHPSLPIESFAKTTSLPSPTQHANLSVPRITQSHLQPHHPLSITLLTFAP